MSADAYSSILTHVTGQTEGIVNFDHLKNGTISLVKFGKNSFNFNEASNSLRYSAVKETNTITVNMAYKRELGSVEVIQSILGVHEWMGHVINSFHHNHQNRYDGAYGLQYKHPTYNHLPKNLRDEVWFRYHNAPYHWK